MGKTALVLSGGGLKGAYEAGVIRAMASAGVIPDVVVGISAGAINGALVSNLVTEGRFRADVIDNELLTLWAQRATMEDFFYTDAGEFARGSLEEASVQHIFHRIGLDPFKRMPWLRLGFDALLAIRELLLGRFTSLCSHGFVQEMLTKHLQPPPLMIRPVTFSVAVSNLLGTTSLENNIISTRHCHYETFQLGSAPCDDWNALYEWMRSVVTASSSVPILFPPLQMHLHDQERPGLYLDGGMVENSPITQAIELDPEVDTVIVVMAATVVGEPSRPPTTFLQMISRVFSIISGRYLIQNYRDVAAMNERILAMREVLDRDATGRILPSAWNDSLCRAAGFESIEAFLCKRYVRLIPIGPSHSLPGSIFSALFYPELKQLYLERGLLDGQAAMEGMAILPPCPFRHDPSLTPP